MIYITVGSALGTGVILAVCMSACQREELYSLRRNEEGERNPDLKWWIFLSIVHVVIVFGWSSLLYNIGVIRLYENYDTFGKGILFFFGYWVIFELWYWISHRLQHMIPCCGILTGHKGELTKKYHHGMTAPYGPDYLTAFSAHPVDSFIVQLAAQSPWIICYVIGTITGTFLEISFFTYGITIAWLVYIDMRAHTRNSYGGYFHCKHHDDPSGGPYSFSGIFDGVLSQVEGLFYKC